MRAIIEVKDGESKLQATLEDSGKWSSKNAQLERVLNTIYPLEGLDTGILERDFVADVARELDGKVIEINEIKPDSEKLKLY